MIFLKFLLIIGGKAKWQADSQEILVTSDSLVHIPAGLAHRQQDNVNEPVILYAIHYRSHLLPEFLQKELTSHDLSCTGTCLAYTPLLARAVRSDFQEMLFEQGSRRQGWEWVLCSRLVELAGHRAVRIRHQDQEGRQPVFIKGIESAERVARYAVALQTRFYQHQSLDEAAIESGLSRRQFTDMFRKVTGESWKRYIHKLRLEHARRLLLVRTKLLPLPAFESGFEDLSYFNHAFKKAYSTSPQMLRRQVPNSAANRHGTTARAQRNSAANNARTRLPGRH